MGAVFLCLSSNRIPSERSIDLVSRIAFLAGTVVGFNVDIHILKVVLHGENIFDLFRYDMGVLDGHLGV